MKAEGKDTFTMFFDFMKGVQVYIPITGHIRRNRESYKNDETSKTHLRVKGDKQLIDPCSCFPAEITTNGLGPTRRRVAVVVIVGMHTHRRPFVDLLSPRCSRFFCYWFPTLGRYRPLQANQSGGNVVLKYLPMEFIFFSCL
jgi:hypothetical protein